MIRMSGAVLAAIIAGFLLIILIASMSIYGWGLFSRATADFRGETGQTEQVLADADFRIQAYDHFYELCSAIQADEGRIENMESELEQDITDKRRSELQTAVTAVRNARGEKIATYNADARREHTVGQFRANDLPFEIDPDEETTCR